MNDPIPSVPIALSDEDRSADMQKAKLAVLAEYLTVGGSPADFADKKLLWLYTKAAEAKAELERLQEQKSELDELAHEIALEDCESVLEAEALICREDGVEWWDMGHEPSYPEALDTARHYLEMRGLLIRHPRHPNWIRIAEEPESGS